MNDKEKTQKQFDLDVEKKELEINKLKKEQEKIELEIRELNKSSFKKTNWWGIIIPLSFSIIPVIYLLFSGIFDSKYQEYKASKASLEYDQKKFTEIRTDIEKRITVIKDSVEIVENLFKTKRDSLQSFKQLVSQKQDSLIKLSNDMSFLKKNIAELETTKELLLGDVKVKEKALGDLVQQKQKMEKQLNDSLNKIRNDLAISNSNLNTMKYYREKGDINASSTIRDLVLQVKLKNKLIKELEEKLAICK